MQRFDVSELPQPLCPWFILQGDQDELVDVDAAVAWVNSLAPGPEFALLAGVDHFFHGRLRELRERVYDMIAPHCVAAADGAG